jgi:hypothetical protein
MADCWEANWYEKIITQANLIGIKFSFIKAKCRMYVWWQLAMSKSPETFSTTTTYNYKQLNHYGRQLGGKLMQKTNEVNLTRIKI